MYLYIATATNYLIYAALINMGQYGAVVDQIMAINPEQAEQYNQLAVMLTTLEPMDTLLGFLERISAMLFHVSCSIIVFKGVREKGRIWLYPAAIALHTAFDCIAGMYQVGIINNIYALEGIIFATSVVVFAGAMIIYRKMPAVYGADEEEKAEKELEDIKKLGL